MVRGGYKEGVRSVEKRGARKLDAGELADAAVTAALVFSLLAIGRVMASGTFFSIIAAIVLAVLKARRRTRVMLLATGTAACLSVLLGGIGPVTNSIVAGAFGYCGGVALTRGWGYWRTLGLTLLIAWPVRSGISVGFLAIVTESRKLVFENIENQWKGLGRIVGGGAWLVRLIGSVPRRAGIIDGDIDGFSVEGFFEGGGEVIAFILDYWYLFLPLFDLPLTLIIAFVVLRLGKRVLKGVNRALAVYNPPAPPASAGAPEPVPLQLVGATLQREDGPVLADDLSLQLEAGDHVIVVGRNGAGKSTLLDTLAGLLPDHQVIRGEAGLGQPGGTSLIGQRPDGQVLAPLVADDLRWGVGEVDVEAALERVGLTHLKDRLTADLSGGELQRLALAGALARNPGLLLADEATAMLDKQGRDMVMELLGEAQRDGTAVVSTSHLTEDRDRADRELRIGAQEHPPEPAPVSVRLGDEVLSIQGVGHTYDKGAPWAHVALRDIDLQLHAGELILITGTNGSGKSTLARIVAGLLQPTVGRVHRVGNARVAIAFQHARLQLLKPTVDKELVSLAGGKPIDQAIKMFDLGPLMSKRIDELSGGQQRRVLLAGLMARNPSVLILDEPLAGLDSEARAQLTDMVDRIRARGTAVVVVSHDPTWGHDRLDHFMDLRGGRIEESRRSTHRAPASQAAVVTPRNLPGAPPPPATEDRVQPPWAAQPAPGPFEMPPAGETDPS